MLKSKLNQTVVFLNRFQSDSQGNVAIMFAFVSLTLLAGVGLAVDGSRVNKAKLELQQTVDAASLAVAKEELTNEPDMEALANGYFESQRDLGVITLNDVNRSGNSYTVDASVPYKTSFMGIFGYDTVNVRARSTTTYEATELNLALVLDTTGSMGDPSGGGTKMSSLKTAATGLVNTLETRGGDAVKVSVVPFAQYVNVNPANRNASWMSASNAGWAGCVGSRAGALDAQAEFGGSPIPAVNGNCGAPILPLTTNKAAVRASINSMTPSGWTYIPSGIAWGLRTLTPGQPMPEMTNASATNSDRIMIVMTDGANTKSKNGVLHNAANIADANTKTQTLCNQVKGQNIKVYTIAYEITDIVTQNMMRGCATTPETYFQADNSAQLQQAFSGIAQSIQNLRLTN